MKLTLSIIIAIGALFAEDKKPTVTDGEQARFYRNLASVARAKEQAKQVEEAANRDIRALIDELQKRGCVAVENDKGLACEAPKPEAAKK